MGHVRAAQCMQYVLISVDPSKEAMSQTSSIALHPRSLEPNPIKPEAPTVCIRSLWDGSLLLALTPAIYQFHPSQLRHASTRKKTLRRDQELQRKQRPVCVCMRVCVCARLVLRACNYCCECMCSSTFFRLGQLMFGVLYLL